LQIGRGLANKVEIKVTELKEESVEYDDDLVVYGETGDWKGGKDFDLQTGSYGWRITNSCEVPLYPALLYFDNSDWTSVSTTTSDNDIHF
jgi:hypothetical protein